VEAARLAAALEIGAAASAFLAAAPGESFATTSSSCVTNFCQPYLAPW